MTDPTQRCVLVIDDEPNVRGLLVRLLEAEGHRVVIAEDGAAGLQAMADHQPACIICDIHMPNLDGPAFYDRAVAADAGVAQRFLVITGDTISPETLDFLARTGLPSLTKPFSVDDILDEVNRILQAGAGPAGS